MNDTGWAEGRRIEAFGAAGPWVIALHGGPGAAGGMESVVQGLTDSCRVLAPWQRGSGDKPLTVARHVADLHELVIARCQGERPALVGASWGAMLALAYAAAHPESAGPLVLVGCGTFDKVARARIPAALEERTTDELRQRLARLDEEIADPGERVSRRQALCGRLYDYDPIPAEPKRDGGGSFDFQAHTETWEDMVRLQEEGIHPAAFTAITSPVLMLHGAYDPHPGGMIRDSLAPYLPQLEYHEWERCGHSPWCERFVRDEFHVVMRQWLASHCDE